MNLFKNVTGSKKTTIAGAVLMAAALGAAFMKLATWAAVSPILIGATYLFIAKDPKSAK